MLNVVVLVGNPKPASRTGKIAEAVADAVLAGREFQRRTIDLAEHAAHIFDWPCDEMAELNRVVAECDLLVVASPTYKATYTGLLKGFLDRYPARGLDGVVAVPVMTGADLTHSMGPDVNLRPLLVELGASTPTRSLYFVTAQMDRMDRIVADWAAENTGFLGGLSPRAATTTP